jgi:hypothetical protein
MRRARSAAVASATRERAGEGGTWLGLGRGGGGSRAREERRKWGDDPVKLKPPFSFINKILDFIIGFKFNFKDEKDIFTNCPQNKSCSKFNSLQLSFRALFKILNRF